MSYSHKPDQVYERDVKDALAEVIKLYPRGTRFAYEPVEPSAAAPARLFIVEEGQGRTPFPGLDHGMLGWTRREARRTLLGIAAGMEAQRVLQGEALRFTAQRLRRRMAQAPATDGVGANLDDQALAALDELTAGF